jgi:hypothetical protein
MCAHKRSINDVKSDKGRAFVSLHSCHCCKSDATAEHAGDIYMTSH